VTLFVVSPHLDDAALSVGASIAARTAAGGDVVVVSVCTVVDHADRVAEDRAAIAALGARHVHLGLLDAPLRGVAENWAGLCDSDDDDAFAAAIAERLRPVLADATEVWGPLAVGGHIDHRATSSALRQLGHFTAWEERPYARQRGAVGAAWRRQGAIVLDEVSAVDVDDHVFFLDAVRAPALARTTTPTVVRLGDRVLHRERILVGDRDREARRRCLQAYASQWPFVVGTVAVGGWPWDDDAEALWRPDV